MKIIVQYEHNGKPIRQLVNYKGRLHRRLCDVLPAFWQEQIHTGEFHNIVDPVKEKELETEFQRVNDTEK